MPLATSMPREATSACLIGQLVVCPFPWATAGILDLKASGGVDGGFH